MLNKIWDWLSGHKTLIATFGLLILEQDFAANWNAGLITILTWIFTTLGGGGLLHKVVKARKTMKKVKKNREAKIK